MRGASARPRPRRRSMRSRRSSTTVSAPGSASKRSAAPSAARWPRPSRPVRRLIEIGGGTGRGRPVACERGREVLMTDASPAMVADRVGQMRAARSDRRSPRRKTLAGSRRPSLPASRRSTAPYSDLRRAQLRLRPDRLRPRHRAPASRRARRCCWSCSGPAVPARCSCETLRGTPAQRLPPLPARRRCQRGWPGATSPFDIIAAATSSGCLAPWFRLGGAAGHRRVRPAERRRALDLAPSAAARVAGSARPQRCRGRLPHWATTFSTASSGPSPHDRGRARTVRARICAPPREEGRGYRGEALLAASLPDEPARTRAMGGSRAHLRGVHGRGAEARGRARRPAAERARPRRRQRLAELSRRARRPPRTRARHPRRLRSTASARRRRSSACRERMRMRGRAVRRDSAAARTASTSRCSTPRSITRPICDAVLARSRSA